MAKWIQNRNRTAFTFAGVLSALSFVGGIDRQRDNVFSGGVALAWPPGGAPLATSHKSV